MLGINCIAVLAFIAMYFCYKPLKGYIRQTTGGKTESVVQDKNIGLSIFAIIFVVGLLVRLIAAGVYRGNEVDMNCFISWGDMVYNDGFKAFYTSEAFTDYPPGYMYILYVIGWLRSLLGIDWNSTASVILTKLPAILADMATGYLIYHVASKKWKETGAAFLSALYIFCPFIITDSAVWGQTDAVFTFFVALMCYFITEKRLIPAYFVFAVGILIKPQTTIFTPVLICGIIDQVFLEDFNWNKFFKNLGLGIAAILLMVVLMLPFGFKEALSQYTDTLGSYEYASVNAYNFWTMFGLNWQSQDGYFCGLTYQMWGSIAIVLIVISSIVISIRCKNSKSKYYFIGAYIVTCVFMFSVRMHERYIFPAMLLLLLCYAQRQRKELYILYTLLSACAFYNTAHVLFVYDVNHFNRLEPIPMVIAAATFAVTGYLIYIAVRLYGKNANEAAEQRSQAAVSKKQVQKNDKKTAKAAESKSKIRLSSELVKMTKQDYIAMFVIMAVYAVVAFVRLGHMSAPKTDYSLVKNGEIILDMGEEVEVAQMWDYLGYKNNPTYYVDYSSDVNGAWTSLYNEDNKFDAGSVFCWNSHDINVTARYFKITPSAENTEDSILELVLTDADGNLLEPVNASEYNQLFDEQDMFEGRATNLNGTIFDEIYHGRTAYEMVHHLYCYENTHPPLGKIFIALGVIIFGMNPFGWRFMGTLFGVLMIPIMYNFAKKFFKETWITVVTTLLFTFDFMHFVQTRIATIDVFVTLFIMLSYYFMYCYTKYSFYDTELKKTFVPLGLCGVAMGLSWASKWTGIYSSAGLCIIFFAQMYKRFREYIYAINYPAGKTGDVEHRYIIENFHKKFFQTIGFCCIFFIAVPAVIYILSYIPFSDGSDRGLIARMIENQKTMYSYHSNLNATHTFGSKWYQWPIMYRPIWYYSGEVSDTIREGISAFGNPLVWWAGIPAFAYMLYLVFKKKDRNATFLSVGYLSQYAPWFMVTRVVFIYHYFPSVPFVTVMVGYSLYDIVKKYPKLKTAVYIYVAIAIGLFALFYPVLAGVGIDIDFAERWLIWFKSWVLLKTW